MTLSQTFREDLQEMRVGWSGIGRMASVEVGGKVLCPQLQQEWEDQV